ncbi:TrmH family RNA methyltransferase [Neotamlana laminarinivorans]|uniref:RNA methyltransferase n=1 Tax=Neotamlana laminarinivorans TaxID=2883124 RepID=A0A9X1L4Q2_9FLAO|nr:RNA methyltransferase [Tamlana laminarinivorans]MCB4799572.1 RNA methyltransferase [Tamlana laminarinivorans]
MLSKSQIKLITSLKQKKYRQQHGLFVVEGLKTINELLQSSFELFKIYTTEHNKFDANSYNTDKEIVITSSELKRISFLSSPNTALAVFKIPSFKKPENSGLILALDDIGDPGNLGTIIRLCDWFGIKNLICSNQTVDCYNPKVIQATMGSITRVNVNYVDLQEYLKNTNLPIYGAFMEGENIYQKQDLNNGILVMGNEANGISTTIEAFISEKISIPRFGSLQATESLNVATATAILLSEFKRRD